MKVMKVEDVMTRTVVVAHEDTPFKELVRLMAEHRVSGLPVVGSKDERLVGIVTEADLLMAEEYEQPPRSLLLEWFIEPDRLRSIEARDEDVRARDLMTHNVVTVSPSTAVHDAVRKLLDEGVKRLPVVDDQGKVLGIVSRRDLLRPFLRSDAQIHQEIVEQVILRTMWMDPDRFTLAVKRGVVTIEGQVDRRSEKEILLELVRRVDGVVGIEDGITFREDDRQVDSGPLAEPRWGLVHGQVR